MSIALFNAEFSRNFSFIITAADNARRSSVPYNFNLLHRTALAVKGGKNTMHLQ